MNIAEMLAPVGGLPEGVEEDMAQEVKTGPDGVTLVSVKPLPPRYERQAWRREDAKEMGR